VANNLKNRTIYVDTSFANSAAYQSVVNGTTTAHVPLRVTGFKLLAGSGAAGTAIVYETISGNQLWNGQAATGLTDSQMFAVPMEVRDFYVTMGGTGAILLIFTA
jgi:hypothetical protein